MITNFQNYNNPVMGYNAQGQLVDLRNSQNPSNNIYGISNLLSPTQSNTVTNALSGNYTLNSSMGAKPATPNAFSQFMGNAGAVTNAASGVLALGTQIFGNLSAPKLQTIDLNTESKGDLLNRVNSFSGYDAGRTNNLLEAGKGALTGASAGTAILPGIGTAIGAVAGGIGGFFSSLFGNKKKKKREMEANRTTRNEFNAQSFLINDNTISNSLANEYAVGGLLNKFAYGGQFSNGLTTFGEGGTHESNPNGGIMIGIGANGQPNMVEENEVRWNDYIFSDRLKVTKLATALKLPSNIVGKSFAQAAEYLQEESKERELDPISRKGLTDSLMKLASAQENVREDIGANNTAEGANTFATGGKVSKEEVVQALMNEGLTREQALPFIDIVGAESSYDPKAFRPESKNPGGGNDEGLFQINSKAWKGMNKKYDLYTLEGGAKAVAEIFKNQGYAPWFGVNNANPYGKGLNLTQKQDPNNLYKNRKFKGVQGSGSSVRSSASSSGIPKDFPSATKSDSVPENINNLLLEMKKRQKTANKEKVTPQVVTKEEQNSLNIPAIASSPLRSTAVTAENPAPTSTLGKLGEIASQASKYAPIIANATTLLNTATSKPSEVSLGRISPRQLTERLTYNPIDSEYQAGLLGQQASATRDAILNSSGGNRSIAQAALLAANKSSQEAIGNALLQGRLANEDRLSRVKSFNSQIERANIANDMQAQQYNSEALAREVMYAEQAKGAKNTMINQGITTLGNQLGQLYREKEENDLIKRATLGYGMDGYTPNFKSFGGKIFKKKIK